MSTLRLDRKRHSFFDLGLKKVTEVTKFTEFGSAKGDCRSRECTNGNIASFLKHAKLVRVYSTVVVV
ncbi:unnamed protein product [Bathycoccus prasinos]